MFTRPEATVTHVRISKGKITFLTRLTFATIIPGARLMHSEKKLKTISPANSITAKSVVLSVALPLHRDLKIPEKTRV
jgi:hypothetical protein